MRKQIRSDEDVATARELGRMLAATLGFAKADRLLVATAISELATNIVRYAEHGEISLSAASRAEETGITVVASDQGPGIADLRLAMRDGYSTSGSLGLGLPGVKRLMDEFDLESSIDAGTIVTVTKWRERDRFAPAG